VPNLMRLCLAWGLLLSPVAGGVATAARNTGPWDLASLDNPPKCTWVESDGPIRSLYYEGEPYQGHPTRVFAYYAVPAKDGQKHPAMVLVHGGGGKAFKEWAELWARRGYVAIAMDLAGRGPDGQRLSDGGPDQGDGEKFTDLAKGIKEAWPYHAVADVIRAHSLIRRLPEVDADRVGITGISWGGYLTCIVAGLDDRFKVAVPVYGCGFLDEDSAWLLVFAKLPPADKALWVKTFDPSNYLPGCHMPMLFVNGTNDFAYPLGSYQKSYRLVKGPRTLCITVNMPHGHVEGWKPKEIGLFVDSVLCKGQPMARFTRLTRDGVKVAAGFDAKVPISRAAMHYTKDSGPWQKRTWQSVPAEVDANEVRCVLPTDKGIVYFLTMTDERGAVVSTEHESL
jgi:dienelactone hydrolase